MFNALQRHHYLALKALFSKDVRHLAPLPRGISGHFEGTAMVMMMKFKHGDGLSVGRKRVRRR